VSASPTCIKVILPELLLQLHKVALHERDLALEARAFGVPPRALYLELIVIEPHDLDVRKARYRARGAADAAPDVEHAHSRAQPHLRREVVLVAGERRSERLARVEAAEVERVGPAVLVQLGRAVVIA
jgi:hypothetical protein